MRWLAPALLAALLACRRGSPDPTEGWPSVLETGTPPPTGDTAPLAPTGSTGDTAPTDTGTPCAVPGPSRRLQGELDLGLDVLATITGANDSTFGYAVASMGDVTGDGLADLTAITLLEELGGDVGGVYLLPSPLPPGASGARAAGVRLLDATAAPEYWGGVMYGTMRPLSDLNGDGLPEVAVSAPLYLDQVAFGTYGRVYVLASPIVAAAGSTLPVEPNYATIGTSNAISLGHAMATADVDDDGVEDLLVSAPDTPYPIDDARRGEVHVFRGPLLAGQWTEDDADWRIYGDNLSLPLYEGPITMGRQVLAGDLGGDGVADVVVTSPSSYVDGAQSTGEVYVFDGPITGDVPTSAATGTIRGDAQWDSLGNIANWLGDTDGNGYGEFGLSSTGGSSSISDFEGHVFLLDGPVTGVVAVSARADSHFYGLEEGDQAGFAAPAGDLDQDGLDDVALAAVAVAGDTRGAVFLYYGAVPRGSMPIDAAPDATLWGAAAGDWPIAVAAGGDVDGDCMPDLVVGARRADAVYVLRGGTF